MSVGVLLYATLLLGACGYLGLAVYVWQHRAVAGARGLVALLLAIGVWTLCYGAELASRDVGTAKLWAGLKFVGVVSAAPSMVAFVTEYTGRGAGIRRRWLVLMAIEPLVVLVLLAYPRTHDLIHFYPGPPDLQLVGGAPVNQAGPLLPVHALYNYVLLVGAIGTFTWRLSRVARPYRRQAVVMIWVTFLPIVGNVFYAFDLTLVDPTPFLFTGTAVVLVWGFLRLRLLDVLPVARSVVMEKMSEGVLVVDVYGRVVDCNPAAAEMVAVPRRELIGRRMAEMAPEVDDAAPEQEPGSTTETQMVLPALPGHPWTQTRDVSLTVTSLADGRGRESARLFVLRDITRLKHTERRLRELLTEQTHLSDTLSESLRPSALPAVPGLVLDARSVPADRRGQVSGDFYDVHPAGRGRWAFALGDVAGNGVRAAVVTAMARYTLRMLSTQQWAPSQVLGQLNQALLGADEPDRFCTVVYGVVEPLADVGALRMTLSLGGHPAPLLRRGDGTVTPIGSAGTVVGLLEQVEHVDETVELWPGDVVLAFTDGVTEARRGRQMFGEERLATVLAGLSVDGPAGVVAARVADEVLGAVEAFGAGLDDVAVLVLVASPVGDPSSVDLLPADRRRGLPDRRLDLDRVAALEAERELHGADHLDLPHTSP